ncbi:oxygenase MpaB family protein [Streptomyces anulatus]|uniref:oxygenase MpaB family protein n=1 Tax=Streptomyces anulatus TaxID=1892 RepID=UPI00367B59C8
MFGIKSRDQIANQFEAPADNGFFGPGSVTWKVWSYPTSYVLGFARAVTIEHLDPNLAAAVVQSGGVRTRTHTRYARTIHYFALVAFGATEPTAKAADVLVKIHTKAIGNDPVTGGTYDANRPDSQLWIHVTAWHSILYCYEKFGPGRLSEAEENQFWADCALAAELQTIDPATVPRSRAEVIEFFESWRPRLAASEDAQDMVDYILQLDVALPPDLPRRTRLAMAPVIWLLRKGVISTYPGYVRKMFGLTQGRGTDLAINAPLTVLHTLLDRVPALKFWFIGLMAPTTTAVLAPVALGIPAVEQTTMTPREAQARYGYDIPEQAHQDLRAKQHQRVFEAGAKPSDEGLIESQEHIGGMIPIARG